MANQVFLQAPSYIEDFPDAYCCDINFKLMKNPTVTSCGHTFECSSITEAVEKRGVCPLDNRKLTTAELVTNYKFKELIDEFRSSLVNIDLYTHYGAKVRIVLSADSTIQRIKELACEHGVLKREDADFGTVSMGYRIAHKGNPLPAHSTIRSLGGNPGDTLTVHAIKVFEGPCGYCTPEEEEKRYCIH